MSRTNQTIRLLAKTFLFSIGLTLVACGGGDDPTTYPSITYTGATGAAVVTEANAADFPVAMLEGSTDSASIPVAAAIDGDAHTEQSAQHTAMLNILTEQVKNDIIKYQDDTNNNVVSAASITELGNCSPNPGSVTIIDNSTPPNLNGSFTYNNLCIDSGFGLEFVMHGKINYNGIYALVAVTVTDPVTGTSTSTNEPVFESLTISIEYLKLTVRTNTESFSEEFSGSISVTYDGTLDNTVTSMTITTNFQANGLTYKIENLEVITTSTSMSIRGRFYHPTYGYVDVITTEPFDLVIGSNPEKYCTGTMQLSGDGGVIDFTANTNCDTYDICFTAAAAGSTPSCKPAVTWP